MGRQSDASTEHTAPGLERRRAQRDFAVDQYRPGEGSGTYGSPLICRTRAQAELTAGALNQAYAAGCQDVSEYRRVRAAS
jgi:hypothetical protein